MKDIRIYRQGLMLAPESARVIIRPFIPSPDLVVSTLGRALALEEGEVLSALEKVLAEFRDRHFAIEPSLERNFEKVMSFLPEGVTKLTISRERLLLIGALFSGEYALESAALFNPSIVPHPDQTGVPEGGLRFIMSLRATGEGHISSIEFRAGTIAADGSITLEHPSRFVTQPEIIPDPSYEKWSFQLKLAEMGVCENLTHQVMAPLGEHFTRSDLNRSVGTMRHENEPASYELTHTLETIDWIADSNYEIRFSKDLAVSERIIFPVSANESNGIEDARFVRFVNDDGTVTYYATYTAYNGHEILPQMIQTKDFLHFHVLTLNGDAVQNKGMALFPRKVGGRYAMLSRQDNENLFIMFSDSPHHWSDPEIIMRPSMLWDLVKVGNCGSPIETEAGWLVLTHGVGAMRKYCIGAILLDLEDPTKLIGALDRPLLSPEGMEREGYVPNVVYSCGGLIHGKELILPYAVSDLASSIATVSMDDLLAALTGKS